MEQEQYDSIGKAMQMKKECAVFGGLLMDKYFEIQSWPERGQDGFIRGEYEAVGGCALNMASTFRNLGGTAHIVSRLGRDRAGQAIGEHLRNGGFSMRYIMEGDGETGYCMVFSEPDGERTFLTKEGMETGFSSRLIPDGLEGIRYAALTGYYLLSKESGELVALLESFVMNGGFLLFDPSPLVSSIDRRVLQRVLAISCLVTPNQSELPIIAEAFSFTGEKMRSVEDFLQACTSKGKCVVLKKGAAGGLAVSPEGSFSYEAAPVPGGIVLDTSGAGDSFAAGLLYGIMDGRPLKAAVDLAAECAAVTVGISGPNGFWRL